MPIRVHPSHRASEWNSPSRGFRTFANPIPLGFVGHCLCCLNFGSFLAGWRSVGNPLIISALALGIAFPGSLLGAIFCMVVNDTLFGAVFVAVGGLWTMIGIAYLPASGLLGYYGSTPETLINQLDSFGIILVWFGILAFILSCIAIRRNLVFVIVFLSACIAALILTSTYFKHSVGESNSSKAGGYFFIVSGISSAYYIVGALLAAERHWIQFPLGVFFADPLRLNDEERAYISGEGYQEGTIDFKQAKNSQTSINDASGSGDKAE